MRNKVIRLVARLVVWKQNSENFVVSWFRASFLKFLSLWDFKAASSNKKSVFSRLYNRIFFPLFRIFFIWLFLYYVQINFLVLSLLLNDSYFLVILSFILWLVPLFFMNISQYKKFGIYLYLLSLFYFLLLSKFMWYKNFSNYAGYCLLAFIESPRKFKVEEVNTASFVDYAKFYIIDPDDTFGLTLLSYLVLFALFWLFVYFKEIKRLLFIMSTFILLYLWYLCCIFLKLYFYRSKTLAKLFKELNCICLEQFAFWLVWFIIVVLLDFIYTVLCIFVIYKTIYTYEGYFGFHDFFFFFVLFLFIIISIKARGGFFEYFINVKNGLFNLLEKIEKERESVDYLSMEYERRLDKFFKKIKNFLKL